MKEIQQIKDSLDGLTGCFVESILSVKKVSKLTGLKPNLKPSVTGDIPVAASIF